MPELGDYYAFRDELARRLRLDVLGPVGGPEELLTEDPPLTVYSTGILFPRRASHISEETSARGAGGGRDVEERDFDLAPSPRAIDDQPDTGVALANIQNPMSMGMTFAVDPAVAPVVRVQAQAAVYEPVDDTGAPAEPRRAERRSTVSQDVRWQRRQLALDPVDLDVTRPFPTEGRLLAPGLLLKARVREPVSGTVAITVTLVNVNETAGFELLSDGLCFFQVELEARGPGDAAPFVERPAPAGSDDEELLLTRLLYRHAPVFATGHGCAVTWDFTAPGAGDAVHAPRRAAVAAVRTDFVPMRDVPLTESNRAIDVSGLGMRRLGTAPRAEVVHSLRRLLDSYGTWISTRMVEAEWLSGGEFGSVARRQIELCSQALDRMREGIDLLEGDEQSFLSFQLANLAMSQQRARTKWIKEGCEGSPVEDGQWRPFQVCFLLLCLAGINDAGHDDRDVADVLWFPTGGGKTEAYLGLIAYTVFLRRLRRGETGAGVTVIMRYTLRLLTLQQFERAAALLCAMELMRQEDVRLGAEQMSIGMWVGRAATPNKLEDARKSLRALQRGESLREQNPVQLRACPWCGTPMDANDYSVPADHSRMDITCRNDACDFHGGLPVHVVDQAIYQVRPTLIIATADKFAQIAWRPDVASLFNRTGATADTPPPDLIIQDELHLISGPLGTLAGLYETAIDLAADRPKVIASTATIRRAEEQGTALFDRRIVQFPPAGLDARDSWFAVQAPKTRMPARLYMGLMTPSTSQASLLIQSYASLLHHAKAVEGSDTVRDPYWTLIGYFNSLRLLAAAELQVQDDVIAQLDRLGRRDGVVPPRAIDATRELTSRVDSSDIPKTLKDLERSLGGDGEPFDVVLATNMISVGVDVDRLGVMAIMGQPQMTAEYIQASSRVGRRHPGLAVVMYNSARSRDRSHYENFASYHSALYRQVESTSVTPFSARARDRALHAAYVGAARMLYPVARDNSAAARVATFVEQLAELREAIVERVSRIAKEEAVATLNELELFTDDWIELAEINPGLVYEAPPRTPYSPRLRRDDAALLRTHADDDLERGWPTLWSLRDVDVEADLYLEK